MQYPHPPQTLVAAFGCALFSILIATASALACCKEGTAQTACSLQRVAELDMLPSDSESVLIPVELDGRPGKLAIDTGGFWGVLPRRSLGGLQSKPAPIKLQAVSGVLEHYATLSSLKIGQLDIRNMEFFTAPDQAFPDSDGTLGANVLKKFDVEVDPGRSKFNLFTQKHCKGQVVYWPQTDAVRIPFEFHNDAILIPIILDGKPLRAMVDTGATESVLSERVATEVFQLSAADLGAPRVFATLDGHGTRGYAHQFKTLQIGSIVFSNPWIHINAPNGEARQAAKTEPDSFPMLIGMHQLRMLHLYIAYGEKAIYASTVSGDALAQAGTTPPELDTDSASAKASASNATGKEVVLSILVRADGSTGDVEVIKSSGSDEQDQKAVDWCRGQIHTPASENGKPFDSKSTITVTFEEE